MSVLKRLWRGELSLRFTFWYFGIGGVWIVSLLPSAMSDALRVVFPHFPDMGALNNPIGATLFTAWAVYYYFVLVAIARSAWNYKSAGNFIEDKVWVILIKILAWIYVIGAGIGGLIFLEGFAIIFGF